MDLKFELISVHVKQKNPKLLFSPNQKTRNIQRIKENAVQKQELRKKANWDLVISSVQMGILKV